MLGLFFRSENKKEDRHHHQGRGVDFGRGAPPFNVGASHGKFLQQPRRAHACDGATRVAGPKDAKGRALAFLAEPNRSERDAYGKGRAAESKAQGRPDETRIGMHTAQKVHGDCR